MGRQITTAIAKIQDALIRLSATTPVQELSVAALCREAGVSRSSFYLHYSHIKEVYDDVVVRMMDDVQLFHDRAGCRECMSTDKAAFCDFIRNNAEWRGIFTDRYFISTWVGLALARPDYDYLAMLKRRGLTKRQAEILYTFHMSGCYAVALSPFAKDADFDQQRRLLDKFIRAGHDAVCSHA